MFNRITLALGVLILAGCAAMPSQTTLGPDHPANPDAPAASLPAVSSTLAIGPAPRTSTINSPEAESSGGHAGHESSGAMSGAQGTAGQQMPDGVKVTDDAGAHATHGAPGSEGSALPPSGSAGGVAQYVCPMHPKVVSANPTDKCPICKMKINKPIKSGAMPATKPEAAPSQGGADNAQGQHGGHE